MPSVYDRNMRSVSGLCALIFVLLVGAHAAAAPAPKAQVMILGVAHLVAKRDVHNSVFQDSPLSPKRQAQMTDVVAHLARFHPTKVLIEASYGEKKILDEYARYLGGHFTLGANEIYQFGFRLAAQEKNATIYPIDTWGASVYDDNSPSGKRIDAYLRAHFNDVKDPRFSVFLARSNALERNGTYLDLMRYINTDAAIRANASWYSMFDGMGREADDAGSAYTAQWYTRNTYIFSNILSVIRPGDRVVVMMGQGHEYLLRDFTQLNPNLVYVDPLQYLNAPANR